MIELADTGLIYRNPKPFLKSIHAWHPTLALLDNGDIAVAYDLADGDVLVAFWCLEDCIHNIRWLRIRVS